LDGLVGLLAEDVVLHSDGGGKGPAVPNAVRGADKVARGVLGGIKKFGSGDLMMRRIVEVNGEPGVVSYRAGEPFSVLTLEVRDGRVQAIYLVTNPEKLAHIAPLSQTR
jgi:RNA polymerase sigma-70 factor (ECF subfamily)